MKSKLHLKNKQSGFTLLESLMALFVLTVGILGVAGLQMQGMQAGNVAKQRMLAVSYAEELIERIRANPIGADGYDGAPASYGCSSGSVCTQAEMAADDLFIWTDNVNRGLPGTPTVNVQVTPVNDVALDPENIGRIVTVNIAWVDRGDNYTFNSSSLVNLR